MEKLYARDLYGQTLLELGKKDPRVVVLDADLSGSTRTAIFGKEFPERFFNVGVAEQNLMATAAGLSSCGKIVFASTFAMFATARPLDQIRNTVCYNNCNVKIVATHGGITVGEDGASHQAIEDVGFLRPIPNIRIIVPCDAWEARAAVLAAYETEGPFYIRLGRSKARTVTQKPPFELGKGQTIEDGRDVALVACGIMVNEALQARDVLKEQGISAAVINMPTIKPVDEDLIVRMAERFGKIVVCEEHQVIGGLYSAVCEVLARTRPVRVAAVAVDNKFGQSGNPEELMKHYGLTPGGIADKAVNLCRQTSGN
ncbi:MAG: transketolase family protein [Candidatus Omnitrophica bacterium]|nr:transketolase family protein [Candidatus Omnitrophota bacterium]